MRIAADVVEAVQQDELHALHVPVLDMRLLNAIVNKKLAALKHEHAMQMLRMRVSYMRQLTVCNSEEWAVLLADAEVELDARDRAWMRC